jgi:ABC-type transport system involved in multi-copper enzyme maturation permease subunit
MYNLAINTLRELLRNRILSVILLFACALIGFSIVLATLSLGESKRIIVDFGLSMIEIGGLIAVIFVGGQILFREIEGRTIYLILSKPIARKDYILGKFIGFWAVVLLIVGIQGLVLLGIMAFQSLAFDPLIFIALASIAVKLLLVFAIILFFSTFSSPLLSILFTLGVYISAHWITGVLDMAIRNGNTAMIYLSKFLMTIFPQFEALNSAKNTLGTPVALDASFYATNFGVAALFLVLTLIAASLIFEFKKFENA